MIAAVLVAGILFRTVEMVAVAGQEAQESGASVSDSAEETDGFLEALAEGTVSGGDAVPMEGTVSSGDAVLMASPVPAGSSEIVSLQIPQRLDVILDPWETDGRGQVYSERYSIQNRGDEPIRLVLKGAIYSPQENGAVIRTETEGLHEGGEKSIYVQMDFGNGDRLILAEEEAEYLITLEPGNELQFWFSGEMNEGSLQPWGDDEVQMEMTYFWSTEESGQNNGEEDREVQG